MNHIKSLLIRFIIMSVIYCYDSLILTLYQTLLFYIVIIKFIVVKKISIF